MKVLITGSQGFIGTYLCKKFLDEGFDVVGIDNFSKYGKVQRPHDDHPNFTLLEIDVLDLNANAVQPHPAFIDADYIIACAAMIGGISYFHRYAYDLLATNERIMASTFDLAIRMYRENRLKKIVVLSSSMVFESTDVYPTPEDEVKICSPPLSTYGFQKLATEYFCKGAHEQYGLPYTIVRPFNCVGSGEDEMMGGDEIYSGNVKMMMSHVLPDIINKIVKGQDPLHILGTGEQVRCYTNGKDIANGIYIATTHTGATNQDYNISTPVSTSVLELAERVWKKLNPNKPFSFVSDEPFAYDVQKRIPDVSKAKNELGFETTISLDESIDEVIEYVKNAQA